MVETRVGLTSLGPGSVRSWWPLLTGAGDITGVSWCFNKALVSWENNLWWWNLIPFHKLSLSRSLKELLSSYSSFVTSWKDPSNEGDIHISPGFRIKFKVLTLTVMVCIFSPDSSTSHTHVHTTSPPPQYQSPLQAIHMTYYATSFLAFKLTLLRTLFPPLFIFHPTSSPNTLSLSFRSYFIFLSQFLCRTLLYTPLTMVQCKQLDLNCE